MEKPLVFVLKLPLEELALRKVVMHLWSLPDILECVRNYFTFLRGHAKKTVWKDTVEDWVKEKVSHLVLPTILKKRMTHTLEIIGLEILNWEVFIEECLHEHPGNFLDLDVLKQICWTSVGTVNYRQTAEKLVTLPKFGAVQRYRIACDHFLENFLPRIWEDLPDEYKSPIDDSIFDRLDPISFADSLFEYYWAFLLKGEEHIILEFCNNYSEILKVSVMLGNKAATEFFFGKLSKEEKDAFILTEFPRANKKNYHTSLTRFPRERSKEPDRYLLSWMTTEQQLQVLRDCPHGIFHTLWQWPWQDLFLEKIDLISSFMCEGGNYRNLADHFGEKINGGDYYFPEVVQEYFPRSPIDFKKKFMAVAQTCIYTLIYVKDEETIKVIFRNLENEDRVIFMTSSLVHSILLGTSACRNRLVRHCVKEALPYKEDRERVKLLYILKSEEGDSWEKFLWDDIFEFKDETNTTGVQKRKLDNECKEDSPKKKT